MKRISVIGVGRLGLSFALLCEAAGYEVMGCDKRKDYVVSLNNRTYKTTEPQIEQMLSSASNFIITTDINKAIKFSDLIFVFVPTPSMDSGKYDHSQIETVISDIKSNYTEPINKTIVISCTVMPKYCADLQERVRHLGINIVYNPEFVAQGMVVHGLENADMILIGGDNIPEELFELYRDIMVVEPTFNILSHTGAEITKIAINCFLTLKTAYANLIGEVAINSGEEKNVNAILEAIGSDSRIGNKFLGYGLPASGVCLPRDVRALREYMLSIGIEKYFISAMINENDRHLQYLKDYFIQNNPDKEVPFIFTQLTYKKGVEIITESGYYKLCKELLNAGYKVNIFESDVVVSAVMPELSKYGNKVTYGNQNGQVSKYEERVLVAQKQKGYVISL